MRNSLRVWLMLVFLVSCVQAHAQTTIFWLDPQDANAYAEFTRREYRIATKMDGPKAAAQLTDHLRVTPSIVPTPETGQTASTFWQVDAPEWWKRVTQGTPGSSPTGQASQGRSISKFFEGLDSYQRVRSTLRATALMLQCLKGLRFEVDAWSMMKNLLVVEEGYALSENGTVFASVPQGAVTVSIVPKGKDTWRDIVKVYDDSPWDDPNHATRWIGPTDLSGIWIDANEVGGDPSLDSTTGLVALLQKVDAGARAAAEGLATIRIGADQARRNALNDAFSPRRLASQVRILNKKILGAYGSMIQLRSLLEGRDPNELLDEYNKLVIFSDEQAKAAQAQAEMSAKWYQDQIDLAGNVTTELELPERLKVVAEIEKEYEALFNLSSNGMGLIRNLDDIMKGLNKVLTQLYPAIAPYVGGSMLPVDTETLINGSANMADNDTLDPNSDIQSEFRDARIRALAVRINYILWEELRACRRLATIQEEVAAANSGLDSDKNALRNMQDTANAQMDRAAQLYRMKLTRDAIEAWANK